MTARFDDIGSDDIVIDFWLFIEVNNTRSNYAPYLLVTPQDQYLLYNEPMVYNLGKPYDLEDDEITVEVNLFGRAEKFVYYEIDKQGDLVFKINPNVTGSIAGNRD